MPQTLEQPQLRMHAADQSDTADAVWRMTDNLVHGELQGSFRQAVPVTPLLEFPNRLLPADIRDRRTRLFLKHEGRMPGGAYKLRGVSSALLHQHRYIRHLVVASTGNHAAETAYAAGIFGAEAMTAVCPEGASATKLHIIKSLGGSILSAPDLHTALDMAKNIGSGPDSLFIHPYDDPAVIAGQGTMALEAVSQLKASGISLDSDSVVYSMPGGGGGLASGNIVALAHTAPNIRMVVGQYDKCAGIIAALRGESLQNDSIDTLCDGAAVARPGVLSMNILSNDSYPAEFDTVTGAQLGEAIAILAQHIEVVEPAGALAFANTLKLLRDSPEIPDIAVSIISGKNTTVEKTRQLMTLAQDAGLISAQQAWKTISQAHTERQVHGMHEVLLSGTAGSTKIRSGTKTISSSAANFRRP